MTTFRFIHTGDLHIDSPFLGLRNLPKKILNEITQSTYRSFDRIVDYCIEKSVDFLLISGDIFDLAEQSLQAQIHFKRSLERLHLEGIHTYIIHGNHDPMDQNKAHMKWPERVHVFSSTQVEGISFVKDNKEVARIIGRSYPTKIFLEDITYEFHKNSTDSFHIGLLHTNVDGKENHDPYCPANLKSLISGEMDYWALGHIHTSEILHQDHPYIIYPGNPQGRHIRETGDRGCYFVEVHDQKVKSIEWLSTSQIRWELHEMNIDGISSADELIQEMETAISEKQQTIGIPLIVRIILRGQTHLHNQLLEESLHTQIQELANESLERQHPWSWIESIQIKTQPLYEIDKIRNEDTFLSEYLNQLETVFSQSNTEKLQNEVLRELFRHRGIKKHLSTLTDEELKEIRNEIIAVVFDYLVEKEE